MSPNLKLPALRMPRRMQQGFTLAELMVTVALIGILMAIAIPNYKAYLIRANKSAVKAAMLEIASRQEQYMMTKGRYTCSDPATADIDPSVTCTTPPTPCSYQVPASGSLSRLGYTVPSEVVTYFDVTITAGLNCSSTVAALQQLPIFTVSASGKAGTIQAGQPAAGATTAYSINQFGLRLPVTAW